MKSALTRDAIGFVLMALVALLLGIGINALRPDPLPLKYVSAAGQLAAATAADSEPTQLISYDETRALVGRPDVIILDARPALFYQAGHLPDALSLPKETFDLDFPKVRSRLRASGIAGIVIYCSGGDCIDSAAVAKRLAAEKVGPLAIYEGGWEEWSSLEPSAGETK